jgi:hypothetical protein
VKLANPGAAFVESTAAPMLRDLGRGQRAAVVARARAVLVSENPDVRRRAALHLGGPAKTKA